MLVLSFKCLGAWPTKREFTQERVEIPGTWFWHSAGKLSKCRSIHGGTIVMEHHVKPEKSFLPRSPRRVGLVLMGDVLGGIPLLNGMVSGGL